MVEPAFLFASEEAAVPRRVISIRHLEGGSAAARAAFERLRLGWPQRTQDLVLADGLLAVRRHPGEVVVVAEKWPAARDLLADLAPGREPEAMAVDLSHALGVIELHGPRLDEWLARLVDRSAISAEGRASGCRLAGVPVLLARTGTDRVLLVADRALFPYLNDWLAFADEAVSPRP